MDIELQQYLRANGLESLLTNYYIKATPHRQFPELLCLKYSQIDSPMGEKISQQCRGIVLDKAQDWSIVSYPYDKFFNYGEGHAAAIDWSTAQVYDKLDGSLMTLYFHAGEWRVQSSGTPDAAGEVNGFGFSFQELFWRVWKSLGYQLPAETDYCFMFEMVTKYNRVVVQPQGEQIVLHGVRHLPSRVEEVPQVWADRYQWQLVDTYPLTSWEAVLTAAKELNPMESEGYIICDAQFQRVKVKSPQYVAIAHLRDGFSTRRMIEIVRTNEGSEFLNYFPEWTELYQDIQGRYQQLTMDIEAAYQQYSQIPVQKDFALAIKDLPYSGLLFSLRAGKIASIATGLQETNIPKLEVLLGLNFVDFSL
jgi:RNA ligase